MADYWCAQSTSTLHNPTKWKKMAKKPEKHKNTEILVAKWEIKKIFFSEPGKPVNNELPTFQVIFISK